MKNFKKIASAIAALSLAACMVAPVATMTSFAAEPTTYSITINTDKTNHDYKAYQIFSGTLSEGTGADEGKKILSNIQWGKGIKDSDYSTIYTELKDLNINSAEDNIFAKDGAALTSAQEVADAIAKLTGTTGSAPMGSIDEVAKVFAKHISTTANPLTKTEGEENYKVDKLDAGYYLVVDGVATESSLADGDALSRYLLQVVDNATATPKASAPSVVKKVQENTNIGESSYKELGEDEQNYNDIADYNIGDDVPFRLYGTMPSTIGDYDHYKYIFHDTIDSPLSLNSGSVMVKIRTKVTGDTYTEWTPKEGTYTLETTGTGDKCSFEISFADIIGLKSDKEEDITINATTVVEVSYTAKLATNAVLGTDGQKNKVKLEYTANPYWEGEEDSDHDETNETPEDGVIVFTYGVDINKVKEDGAEKLANAVFAVYKEDASGNKSYVTVTDGTLGWTSSEPTKSGDSWTGVAGAFVSNGSTDIEIKGLDAGTYYIKELEAPSGYNKLTDDIKVVVTPTIKTERNSWTYGTEHTNATDALSELKIEYGESKTYDTAKTNATDVSVDSGKGTVTIKNEKGAVLPSTGGIGTTLFYLGGGALVAVAGVMLITKKRMTKE